jgi:hypothetical protein
LTLRCVVRTVSIIDSHGLVDSSVRRSSPRIPSRISVSVVHPFAQRAGGAGVGVFELVRATCELLERARVVGLPPRPTHPRLDRCGHARGDAASRCALCATDISAPGPRRTPSAQPS